MNTVIRSFVNESNVVGNRLEARIVDTGIGYTVEFYVNDGLKTQASFDKAQGLSVVEQHAQDWLKEVRNLNG